MYEYLSFVFLSVKVPAAVGCWRVYVVQYDGMPLYCLLPYCSPMYYSYCYLCVVVCDQACSPLGCIISTDTDGCAGCRRVKNSGSMSRKHTLGFRGDAGNRHDASPRVYGSTVSYYGEFGCESSARHAHCPPEFASKRCEASLRDLDPSCPLFTTARLFPL